MINHTYTDVEKLLTENDKLRHQLKRIKESKSEWYETLFNRSNEAIAICEEFSGFPSRIVNCNNEFANILKLKCEHLIGLDFMDLLRVGQKRKFFIRTFESGRAQAIENLALVFIDGEKKEQNIEICTQKLQDGNKELIVITLQPVNDSNGIIQKGMEQVLSSSNQVFFNFSNNDTLSFKHVSLSAYKVTGFSAHQLQLNPFTFWNNCHPDDLKKIKSFIQNDNENYYFQINIRFIRKDEQMIWISLCIIKNVNKTDGQTDYYAIGQEITSQQRKKRLANKRELYHKLTLQSSKYLFQDENEAAIRHICHLLLKPLKADRVAIHIIDKGAKGISYNAFKSNITLEEKSFLPSNETIWTEYENIFKTTPLISYQSLNDGYVFGREEPHFFAHKNQKSVLLLPIANENLVIGFIALATIKKNTNWDRADINVISEISDIIAFSR